MIGNFQLNARLFTKFSVSVTHTSERYDALTWLVFFEPTIVFKMIEFNLDKNILPSRPFEKLLYSQLTLNLRGSWRGF